MSVGPRPRWRNLTASLVEVWCRGWSSSGRSRDWEIDPAPSSLDSTVSGGNGPLCQWEESAQQIKLRAERLGDIDSEFYLYAETNMQSVRAEVERIQPDFLIIDSIQTIMSPEISGCRVSLSGARGNS